MVSCPDRTRSRDCKIELTDADLFVASEEYQLFLAYKEQLLWKMDDALESLSADAKKHAEMIFVAIRNESDTETKLALFAELSALTGIDYLENYRQIGDRYHEIRSQYSFTSEKLFRAFYSASSSYQPRKIRHGMEL